MLVLRLFTVFALTGLFATHAFAGACDDYYQLGGNIFYGQRYDMSTDTCILLDCRAPTADSQLDIGYNSCDTVCNGMKVLITYDYGIGTPVPVTFREILTDVLYYGCSCKPGYELNDSGYIFPSVPIVFQKCLACSSGEYKENINGECSPCPNGGNGSDSVRNSASSCYKDCPTVNTTDNFGSYSIPAAKVYWTL